MHETSITTQCISKTAEFMTNNVDPDKTQRSAKSGLDHECLFGLFVGVIKANTVPFYQSREYI